MLDWKEELQNSFPDVTPLGSQLHKVDKHILCSTEDKELVRDDLHVPQGTKIAKDIANG
jgi:hypothetical protein